MAFHTNKSVVVTTANNTRVSDGTAPKLVYTLTYFCIADLRVKKKTVTNERSIVSSYLLFRCAAVCIRCKEIWNRCCLTLDYMKKLRGITQMMSCTAQYFIPRRAPSLEASRIASPLWNCVA